MRCRAKGTDLKQQIYILEARQADLVCMIAQYPQNI
jgi:hypothetical protein